MTEEAIRVLRTLSAEELVVLPGWVALEHGDIRFNDYGYGFTQMWKRESSPGEVVRFWVWVDAQALQSVAKVEVWVPEVRTWSGLGRVMGWPDGAVPYDEIDGDREAYESCGPAARELTRMVSFVLSAG